MIIFEVSGNEIGLLATEPVDIVEADVSIDELTLKQTGILGSAIIEDRTTLIVDIFGLVRAAHPEWVAAGAPARASKSASATSAPSAEDSTFFRNQVRKFRKMPMMRLSPPKTASRHGIT